ncbi:DNA gyrase subunit A [Zongyangia hominis]|uniref:DNA gyrase subunit A n=1 Tax=Zongyangia hominis TaxID=2763677 RepID=A0A926I720_9FIRM|nr:DNA gyrase subunit A [Zongyangia hominis]MBC8570629.1 DNA gyrase subunit A [Zongyangia hominis]
MNNNDSKVITVDIEKEMKKAYLEYSMSVIVGRALPDVRDGLKPVHRRILYTFHENGLGPDKAYRKCADTVGSVLGRYHPHGDASVYDAMVRLAQDFSMRYPLVDGHGNFGSVDGDPPAAYRYTESRMSKIATKLLTDIEKETVDFVPNYDDRLKEPAVLPSRFPNLLVNGSTGIAVGMATNIPPHNLREVIDGACYLIDNPECDLIDLMEFIHGPDFPTGGIIMGRAGIRAAYQTGRGRLIVRARASIEEGKKNRMRIVVTELPYMVNKARLIESIANLVKEKRIDGISDLRDESDREGMRIVIELKKDANAQVVLNQLYSFTQLQDTCGVIMLALHDGAPKVMGLKEVLTHYIHFQFEVITRRTEYDLRKARERAHILEGLKIALDFIDEVVALLRAAKSIAEGKEQLMERFGLTEVQAAAIVAMRLGQLTGLERQKIEDELAALKEKIQELMGILADEDKVYAIVKEELQEIRDKFGDERRTEIQSVSGEVDIEDLIPEEDCVVTLTHFGYIKRQAVDSYRTQRRGGRGISGMTTREEDFVEDLYISSTHDYLLFLTSKGRMYRLKCYEIPESSRTSKGVNIVNLLPLEGDEKIASMIKLDSPDQDGFLVMVTRHGIIKRTAISAFRNIRKSGLIAVTIDEGDELAWVRLTSGQNDLIVATKNGMSIKFNENDVRPMGRSARGVKAITLDEGDVVVGMARIREGATLLTVSDKGLGRRSRLDDYRMQSRGGKGIKNYKVSEQKGHVAGVKVVDDDDDVIMITDGGVIIRIPVSQIPVHSRYGTGVKCMRVTDDTSVVTLARAPKEMEVEEEEAPSEEAEGSEESASAQTPTEEE